MSSVLSQLRREHVSGKYLYRGQCVRYPRHAFRFGASGQDALIESIYPKDFRFIGAYSSADALAADEITNGRRDDRNRRDRFESCWKIAVLESMLRENSAARGRASAFELDVQRALLESMFDRAGTTSLRQRVERLIEARAEALEWFAPAVLAFLGKVLSAFKHFRRQDTHTDEALIEAANSAGFRFRQEPLDQWMWSLAQHYQLSTALLDVTESVDVAACFAVFPAPKVARCSSGVGVIYRIEISVLRRTLEVRWIQLARTLVAQGKHPPIAPFLTRCHDIPEAVAQRPARQTAVSVHGMADPGVIWKLVSSGGLEIFEFEHSDEPLSLPFDLDYLMPAAGDPFMDFVDMYLELDASGCLQAFETWNSGA